MNIIINYIFAIIHCIGFAGLINVIFDQVKFHGTAPLVPVMWIFVTLPLHMIYIKMVKLNRIKIGEEE